MVYNPTLHHTEPFGNTESQRSFQESARRSTFDYTSIHARGPLLDKVFSLRYKSYAAENYINTNETGRFMDEYDTHKDNRSFLTYFGGRAIGSIRGCAYNPENPNPLPVMQPFGEEIRESLGLDNPLVEANRFVVDPEFQRRGGIKARFNIFRNIMDMALELDARHIIAAVREEHAKFYRMLLFRPVGETAPKAYPGLNFKVVLLACSDMERLQKLVYRKAS